MRADGPQGHLVKQGTPTMGGVLILFVIAVVFVIMGAPTRFTLSALIATLACGLLGFIDDWAKVTHARSLGLRPRAKLFWQAFVAVIVRPRRSQLGELAHVDRGPWRPPIRIGTEHVTSTFHSAA